MKSFKSNHFFRYNLSVVLTVIYLLSMQSINASKLTTVEIIDKGVIFASFKDGDIIFRDDAKGPSAYLSMNDPTENSVVMYGNPLNVEFATSVSNWKIRSSDDSAYGSAGKSPQVCFRKSKINGMGLFERNETSGNDYNWVTPMQHNIFLILPSPLKENATYTIEIDPKTETDKTKASVKFDIFNSRSEAIHTNIVGYSPSNVTKSADVSFWMGDGKGRDYSSFVGNKVYLYNIDKKTKKEVGKLEFWKENQREVQHNFMQTDVWIADFPTNVEQGNYRIAIEGIGCSDDFEIKRAIYKTPYAVSVRGFYYMRIGEDCMECVPVPRRPLFIPGVNPENTTVYITTMHPYHPEWKTFSRGDVWDVANDWRRFKKEGSPTNPKAIGGHSDAYDWDRHLGHVSIIYDMLLPFIMTDAVLTDDDCNIRESGNGIPDILDEARNEVDFWLNLRDGEGYSHGVTCPNNINEFYQAGITNIAAWANAVNSAMLAYCFQLINKKDLEKQYLDSALVAFNYAIKQPDQMLDSIQDMGNIAVRGKDLKMTAAVFLYNLTGDRKYEDIFYENCEVKTDNSVIAESRKKFQTWAVAGYLFTKRPVNYPQLYNNIVNSVIAEAHLKEAGFTNIRPSRRGTDNEISHFPTPHNMHRTMIAHAVTKNAKEKEFFMRAMLLEVDWGLGRNPLNLIHMTTATTPLESKRSVINMFTVGRNDGTPGMHPGHTPYLNAYDWGGNRPPASPSWMIRKNFPEETNLRSLEVWPYGEIFFDTRYVYAHSEFTPQQTMRGKMALYGYLYALDKK